MSRSAVSRALRRSFDEASGKDAALALPFADTAAMQLLLDEISRHIANGAHAVHLLDRAGRLRRPSPKSPKTSRRPECMIGPISVLLNSFGISTAPTTMKKRLRYCRGAIILGASRQLESHFDYRRSLIQIDAPRRVEFDDLSSRIRGAQMFRKANSFASLFVNRSVWLIGLLLCLRAIFLLLGDGTINGDGTLYVKAAQEILQSGHLPPARFQSLGFAVVLAPIIALTGQNAIGFNYDPKVLYLGDRIANTVHVVQVAMDLVIVLILIREAAKLLAGRTKKPIVTSALAFLALQPFTATMAAFVYPDHMCMFFFFVGGYLILRPLSGSRGVWGLAFGSAMLGIAGLIRFEMLPVCGALLFVLWFVLVRQRGARACLSAIAVSAALFLSPAAGMSIFQYRSTGEIGYVRVDTAQNSNNVRGGFNAWLRTWIILVDESLAFSFPEVTPNWAGFDINAYPHRAFKSDQQRNEIAKLLFSWRESGYTKEIDTEFMKIARADWREYPVTTFILVPVGRMLHYWINLEGARAIHVTLGLEPPWSRVATALVFPFRLLFVGLAAVGFFVVWIEHRSRMLRWGDDLDFARVCSLMVVLRTGEFCVFGLFLGAGAMETRYVIVALPAMLMLAVVGLRRIAGADEFLAANDDVDGRAGRLAGGIKQESSTVET